MSVVIFKSDTYLQRDFLVCVCGFFLLGTSFEYGTAERRVPRFASNRFDFSNSVETGRLQLWRKKKVGCVFRSRWQHFFPSSLDLIEQTMLFYQRPSTLWLLSHVENALLEISVLVKVLVRCNSANQDSKFQVPKVIEKGFFRFFLLKSKSLPGNLKPCSDFRWRIYVVNTFLPWNGGFFSNFEIPWIFLTKFSVKLKNHTFKCLQRSDLFTLKLMRIIFCHCLGVEILLF